MKMTLDLRRRLCPSSIYVHMALVTRYFVLCNMLEATACITRIIY